MRVLYVEDNPLDSDLLFRELARHAPDYQVDVVPTLHEARACLARDAAYDLVLVDLRLPDGSGLDLLNEIREQALPMAIVVLTGSGDEEAAIAALKAGADDYLIKREDYLARLPHALDVALNHFRAETARKARSLHVLYAEHNAADIDLTRRHLARHASHIQLEVVHSADDVLERMPRTFSEPYPCDVLLLDFRLPGLNALELLKVLRQERALDLPIVLVTGQGDEEVALHAWRLGATDYLVKNAGYLHKLPVIVENAFHRVQLIREQNALNESEARYRRLAENAQDLIYRYRLSPTPGFEYVNPAAVPITGYTPEDHYADPDLGFKLVHPDDRQLLSQVATGESISQPVVLRWVRKNGSILWTEQHNVPVYDDQGNLIALEGIARDITEQKLAEDRLRKSEENFRLLFESNPHPMWVYDQETLAFLEVNEAAVVHYGYSRDEFLAMKITDIRPPEDVDRLLEFIRSERPALRHSGEWRHRLKNGEIIDVEIISHTIEFAGRKARLVVAQDITERKRAQMAEREQRAMIEALADTATALNSTLNLEQVLDRILQNIGRVVPHDAAYIMLIDSGVARVARCWGFAEYGVEEAMQAFQIPVAELYDLQWMVEHMQPIVIPATHAHDKWVDFPVTRWANSYVGAPLFREGYVMGFLGLLSRDPNFFTAAHAARLQAFADHAAISLFNAQLFAEEREQRALAQALRDTASALINVIDLDAVMNILLENVAHVVPHAAANIMLIEGDLARPVYWHGYRPERVPMLQNFRISVSETPNLRQMVETGASFLASYIDQYTDWVHQPLTDWVKSYVAAPIRSHGNVIGFLNLDSDIPGFFTEVHTHRLQAFADQASIAIEHAQLYEEIRRYASELEQRVAERTIQLDRMLRRIEAILNSSDDIIVLCRPDGTIEQVNPAFTRALSCQSEEALFQPVTQLVLPEHVPLLEHAFEEVITTLHSRRLEITLHCKGHAAFDADLVLSPVTEQTKQIAGVICSFRDITQRKQLEDQLRQMLEHEMNLSELKSRYVSMAAHDLRNPLAIIQSAVSIIHQYGDRLTPEKKEEKYATIRTSIQLMVEMLDDILTLGKVESGKLGFEPVSLDVVAFCENLVEEMRQAAATSQAIHFNFQGDCSTALLDARLLRHILGNLLSNALKYSPQDRPVTFSVRREPDQITFEIQDQGIGIPEDDQKRLFETFHRASNARQIPGTGLGLAIVKQSVELHQGTISFESEEGRGTTFTVVIPQSLLEHA